MSYELTKTAQWPFSKQYPKMISKVLVHSALTKPSWPLRQLTANTRFPYPRILLLSVGNPENGYLLS